MAADDLLTEYHLTPAGWITGTRKLFGRIDGLEVKRPQDAVETWTDHIYQRSMWSQEQNTVEMIWHDAATSAADREALHAKFPRQF